MRILIDTNVLIDFMMGRAPHFENADKIIKMCAKHKVQGAIAAHSIPNIFYILRKDLPEQERRAVLLSLCTILTVEGIDSAKLITALKNSEFSDLEDCLQSECAKKVRADYIVTRNLKDFTTSEVRAVSPEKFLEIVGN